MPDKIIRDVDNSLYNLDRAAASLGGAEPQETISSEAGRHAKTNIFARALAAVLNKIQKNHTANAIAHANKLDAADNGDEQ